jgi:hypothetical protein
MAAKSKVKVGAQVSFGKPGAKKLKGKVVKCNDKTCNIKVPRDGEYQVSYKFVTVPAAKKSPAKKVAPKRKPAAKKNPGKKTSTRMKRGVLYRVPGTSNTVEKVAWGYIIRDAAGNKLGERSTRKLALEFGTRMKKNPARPRRLGGRYQEMLEHEADADWGASESMAFHTTAPAPRRSRQAPKKNPPKPKVGDIVAFGIGRNKRTGQVVKKGDIANSWFVETRGGSIYRVGEEIITEVTPKGATGLRSAAGRAASSRRAKAKKRAAAARKAAASRIRKKIN